MAEGKRHKSHTCVNMTCAKYRSLMQNRITSLPSLFDRIFINILRNGIKMSVPKAVIAGSSGCRDKSLTLQMFRIHLSNITVMVQ